MLGGELPSARRGAGLIQHRRALRRRFAQVNGVDAVIVSLVPDAMHLRRIGEDAARAIAQRRIVLPASFPELVDHLHIFVGDVVAVVMRGLLVLAGAFGRAVEIAGHHVPADPPLGQMVERRHPPRERIGRLIGQVGGHPETEIFGDRGHRRNQQQRIVGGRLRGVAQRRVRTAAEHVIDAEHIGEKQAVEPPALQRFGQIDPVRQPVIFRRAVARMGPQPRRLMRDAVHGEGVEPDFFFHERTALDLTLLSPGRRPGLSAEIVAFRPVRAKQIVGVMPLPAGFVSRYVDRPRSLATPKGRHDQN